MPRPLLLLVALLASGAGRATAQAWNSEAALALARRAIHRRDRAAADTTLRDYKALAHGFVFFLGQFGEGLTEPPRLIKADQLELEVYWKAPGASKQRIIGWRDQAQLPTDIQYHRDHLGIIQNNFGRAIRLGDGDEVQDVPHPLSPGGPLDYDYRLGDTLVLTLSGSEVRVVGLEVRPKDFRAPRIVGTLYVDIARADLVRMAFNFTPAAYRDPELEDVSVVLDDALWEQRYWLPYRQEIEIRRRATWLDIPARGIIRGRWEIGDYRFNLGLSDRWFAGEEISPLPKAERDSFPWPVPLAVAIQGVADPVRLNDLEAVRDQVTQIAGQRALNGLQHRRLAARGVSDLLHVNRVEGLTPGAGVTVRTGDRAEFRALASYGTGDHRPKGSLRGTLAAGHGTLTVAAYRQIRDVADQPVIAPLFNSISTQEWGRDYGDYYLADGARLGYRRGLGTRGEWSAEVGRERIGSLATVGAPVTGHFAPNPALGEGGRSLDLARAVIRRRSVGFAVRRDLALEASLEGGRIDGGATYLRGAANGHLLLPLGGHPGAGPRRCRVRVRQSPSSPLLHVGGARDTAGGRLPRVGRHPGRAVAPRMAYPGALLESSCGCLRSHARHAHTRPLRGCGVGGSPGGGNALDSGAGDADHAGIGVGVAGRHPHRRRLRHGESAGALRLRRRARFLGHSLTFADWTAPTAGLGLGHP